MPATTESLVYQRLSQRVSAVASLARGWHRVEVGRILDEMAELLAALARAVEAEADDADT